MSQVLSGQAMNAQENRPEARIGHMEAKTNLTKLAAWISDRDIPFLITSIGMIVMLLSARVL